MTWEERITIDPAETETVETVGNGDSALRNGDSALISPFYPPKR